MPVGIQIVRKEKQESALDKVMKGVSLANSIVGTVDNAMSIKDRMAARDIAARQAADAQGGVYTQKELDAGGFVNAADGETGAMRRRLRQGDQVTDVVVKKYEKPDAMKAMSPLEEEKTRAEIAKLNAEAKKANRGDGDGSSKEFKQNQYAAAGFANRAVDAEAALSKLLDPEGGFKVEWRPMDRFRREQDLPQDVKMFNQIKRDFVSAVLRKESGASIADTERSEKEQEFFPQPGDGADVLARKAQARANAIAALEAEAGNALAQVQERRGIMDFVAQGKEYKSRAPAPAAGNDGGGDVQKASRAQAVAQKALATKSKEQIQKEAAALMKQMEQQQIKARPRS